MELFLVIILLSAPVLICIAFWYFNKKRTLDFKAVADSLNFSFYLRGSDSFIESLDRFHLFSAGHVQKVTNLMYGRVNEIDVSIFDYRYTTGHGKHSRVWRQTVLLFKSDLLELTPFTLCPETISDKIFSVFGSKDIDFDSHPVFSKQYLLRADYEQACRAIFTPNVLDYYDPRKGLSTEGNGDTLLFYRSAKKVNPADLRSFLEEGIEVFGLFMTHE